MDKFESDSNGDHILTIDQLKDVASTFGTEVCTSMDCKKSC